MGALQQHNQPTASFDKDSIFVDVDLAQWVKQKTVYTHNRRLNKQGYKKYIEKYTTVETTFCLTANQCALADSIP